MSSLPTESLFAPNFDDLFGYVHDCLLTEAGIDPDANDFDVMAALGACSRRLLHVEDFCVETDTDFDRLRDILQHCGGNCDCEVLLNCTVQIDADRELPRRW